MDDLKVFSPDSATIDSQKGKPVPFQNILTKMDIWVLSKSLIGTELLGAHPSSVTWVLGLRTA